jgi:pSer/pThr/pTyr-binding forkhead associated (FHA) protein
MIDKTVYKRDDKGKKLSQQDAGNVKRLRFKERDIELEKIITIGRDEKNSIVISDDPLVSRQHAIIEKEGACYYLMDRNSTNGTYVNNNPLKKDARHELKPGDVVTVGKTKLQIL